ncbi:type II toxin-antitoxin system RelE/ParE family toxin [Pseudoxanthomonas sp. UC19_8]|uniref:type II toxin-antitoxin system RelE/ParE family toxin n=1 Tax=Pseudoxanthomonas sp. UC19_8 TaxID=3350175 RepID=UPI0036D2F9CC
MAWTIRFTEEAQQDLERLYDWLLQHAAWDYSVAERALQAMREGIALLECAPMSCRKATADPFLRELVMGLSSAGYVLLFEIENSTTVTVLAVRHQREDDYH